MAKFRTELRRKYIHLIGLVVPALYWLTNKQVTLCFVAFFLLLFTAFEFYRIKRGIPVKEADAIAKPLIRSHEKRGIGAHVFFAAGAFVVVLAYPQEIAISALLMATLADGGAAVVGSMWGRHKLIGRKTLEGSLTLFLIAIALAVWIVEPLLAAFVGAIVAACVELLPMNDNLTVPVVAGLAMHVVRYFS